MERLDILVLIRWNSHLELGLGGPNFVEGREHTQTDHHTHRPCAKLMTVGSLVKMIIMHYNVITLSKNKLTESTFSVIILESMSFSSKYILFISQKKKYIYTLYKTIYH